MHGISPKPVRFSRSVSSRFLVTFASSDSKDLLLLDPRALIDPHTFLVPKILKSQSEFEHVSFIFPAYYKFSKSVLFFN